MKTRISNCSPVSGAAQPTPDEPPPKSSLENEPRMSTVRSAHKIPGQVLRIDLSRDYRCPCGSTGPGPVPAQTHRPAAMDAREQAFMRRIRLVTAIMGRRGRRMTVPRMNPHAELDDLYRTRTLNPLKSGSTESAIGSLT